jgi:hypothetical protein
MPNRCPVCDRADLAADLDRCPQCGADLECFRLLDALPEPIPPGQKHNQVDGALVDTRLDALQVPIDAHIDAWARSNRRLARANLAALVSTAVLTVALLYSLLSRPPTREAPTVSAAPPPAPPALPSQTTLARIDAVAEGLDRRMVGLRQGLSAALARIDQRLDTLEGTLRPPPSPAERPARESVPVAAPVELAGTDGGEPMASRPYSPRSGDSLWTIARSHLGQGHLYPLLLELNPGLGVELDPADGPIRVPADPRQARARMSDLTVQQGSRQLFRARVLPGDDWQGLAKRYYGRTDRAAQLRNLNGGAPMPAAGRVLVPLWE